MEQLSSDLPSILHNIEMKPETSEIMALHTLARNLDEAMLPKPEEYFLMKNYKSACPPVIRNFGAYSFGGVSKTLHLTEEVYREKVRSLADVELQLPENKDIENNYESMLGMQIAENRALGRINLATKFEQGVLEDEGDNLEVEEMPIFVETIELLDTAPPTPGTGVGGTSPDPQTPPGEPPSTPQHLTNEDDNNDNLIEEDTIDKQVDRHLQNIVILDDPYVNSLEEVPEELPQRNVKKSTAMPLSVKMTRQVLPEIDEPYVSPPSPERVYLDFTKQAYVKVVRLTEMQIRRASTRKRKRLRMENWAPEVMESRNLEKSEDIDVPPVRKRRQPEQRTICQMLSRSASLDDDYGDADVDDDNSRSSTEKFENHPEFVQGNEFENENENETESQSPSPSRETSNNDSGSQPESSQKSNVKVQEFDIFQVPRPLKKTPSNYREKYENRPIFQKEQEKRTNKNKTDNQKSRSASLDGTNVVSRSKSSRETKAYSKYDEFDMSKKSRKGAQVVKRSKSESSATNGSRNKKNNQLINGHSAPGNPSVKPKTQQQLEQERRKLRNHQNLANAERTGCFKISGEADHLKEFKIPKKNKSEKETSRKNVQFFDKASSTDPPCPVMKKPRTRNLHSVEEDYETREWAVITEKCSKTPNTNKTDAKNESKYGSVKSVMEKYIPGVKRSFSSEPPGNLQLSDDENSGDSSSHSFEEGAAPGEVSNGHDLTNRNIIHFQLQGQSPENSPDLIPMDSWELHRAVEAGNLEVYRHQNFPEADGYIYTLAPGPTNESNQAVQVPIGEGEQPFFTADHAIECIGEVEVQTSPEDLAGNQVPVNQVPVNQVPVITMVEPVQTQSGEVTTTTACDPKRTELSDEESRTSPPSTISAKPSSAGNDSVNKAVVARKTWQTDSASNTGSSCSGSCSSSCSSSGSGSETETE